MYVDGQGIITEGQIYNLFTNFRSVDTLRDKPRPD